MAIVLKYDLYSGVYDCRVTIEQMEVNYVY